MRKSNPEVGSAGVQLDDAEAIADSSDTLAYLADMAAALGALAARAGATHVARAFAVAHAQADADLHLAIRQPSKTARLSSPA